MFTTKGYHAIRKMNETTRIMIDLRSMKSLGPLGRKGGVSHQRDRRGSRGHCFERINPAMRLGHRVVARTAPGMAATEPMSGQPRTAQGPMLFHRLQSILRACGFKTAACQRAKYNCQHGRDHSLIDAHAQDQNSLDRVHGVVSLADVSSFALLRVVKKSCSTSENLLPAIDGRATSTISTFRLR